MIKVHLVQMYYNPAYFDSSVDFLAELYFPLGKEECPLSKIKSVDSRIYRWLEDACKEYIDYIKQKVLSIMEWCAEHNSCLIVFPEYSIPLELLSMVKSFAESHQLAILAGSHRVPQTEKAASVYKALGMESFFSPGTACAPLFLPDGTVMVFRKAKASKFEPELVEGDSSRQYVARIILKEQPINIGCIICVESLYPEVFGQLWADRSKIPDLILCPSLSQITDPFSNVGKLAGINNTVFAYVNSAAYGGTTFIIPERKLQLLAGPRYSRPPLDKEVEAVLELEFDPESLRVSTDGVTEMQLGSYPIAFPLVYPHSAKWYSEYNAAMELVRQRAKSEEIGDLLSFFVTEHGTHIPQLLRDAMNYVIRYAIPNYAGDKQHIVKFLGVVSVDQSLEPPPIFYARRVASAIVELVQILEESSVTNAELIARQVVSLKKAQARLPAVEEVEEEAVGRNRWKLKRAPRFLLRSSLERSGDELVSAFQDRGPEFDRLRDFITRDNCRIIFITGPLGIGKTECVNAFFAKVLTDWDVVKVGLPIGATTVRMVVQIAEALGGSIDADALAASTHRVFRHSVRKLLSRFYAREKRALVIDDLYNLLYNATARDYHLLKIFISEAANPLDFRGGRIIIISSIMVPQELLFHETVYHLVVRRLHQRYIYRIFEYQMRKLGMLPTEKAPSLPQELVEMVGGHPLSAILCVDVIRQRGLDGVSLLREEVSIIRKEVTAELLREVELSDEESQTLKKLSVFRLPIPLEALRKLSCNKNVINKLVERCIINFDGDLYELHEIIRRHFYDLLAASGLAQVYHSQAADFYESLLKQSTRYLEDLPSLMLELAYHLIKAGEETKAREILSMPVVEEIKAAARELYKSGDYDRAFDIYKLLTDVIQNDPIIWAYLGRCYARKFLWKESDDAFKKAIQTAQANGMATWWIKRDWGHIKARFNFYEEAEDLFREAEAVVGDEYSILANRAVMSWRKGDYKNAEELFKRAYELNPKSKYTLIFYIRFLKDRGDFTYAKALEHELERIRFVDFEPPSEFEPEDYEED